MRKRKKKRGLNKNINKIKEHDFVHGRYRIFWKKPKGKDVQGECSDPNDRKMWINPRLNDLDLLRTCIDESTHACAWLVDNDYVGEMSDSIAEFLYRIGYRLEKRDGK